MKIVLILRNVICALNTLHIRGDEAKVFADAMHALNAVLEAFEKAEKNQTEPTAERKDDEP